MEVIQRIFRHRAWIALVITCAVLVPPAFAQEDDELRLMVRRTFGYRGGDAIQGKFSLEVEGPAELVQVTFVIDRETMAEDQEPPFEYRFDTSEYSLGSHRLMATGRLANGRELRTVERSFEFVSAEASWAAAGRMVTPLLLSVLGLIALGVVVPAIVSRRRGFRLGIYGSAGGAICPSCQLPFSRSFFSPNLLRGKVERCPHCGKWSVVGRAPASALEEAEQRFRSAGESKFEAGPDRIRRLIDESRFES